jgi:quercetin dioxygenase-like cupin family protein
MKYYNYLTKLVILSIIFIVTTNSYSQEKNLQKKISFEILNKGSMSWDNTLLPEYPVGQPEITIIRVVIPPNTSIALHKHAMISFGYVVKGSLNVNSIDNKTLILNAGDTIVELVEKWHNAKTAKNSEVELIVFYLGPSPHPMAVYKNID